MKLFLTLFFVVFFPFSAYANGKPAGVGNADHVDAWHGTGDGHQANNEPGDTAADRHNFDDEAAGGSGKNPRENANGG
jgi:hypothetical protein